MLKLYSAIKNVNVLMNWPKKTRNHRNFTVLVIVSIFFVPILQQSTFGNHGKEIH